MALSGNEQILAVALARHWVEEPRLPAIRTALSALPEANAADLLCEQGMIDSEQRAWLQRLETNLPEEERREPFVDRCLTEAAELGASDLHLVPLHPPLCRCHDLLRRLRSDWEALLPQQVEEMVVRILPPGERAALARQGRISCLYGRDGPRARLTVGRDAKGYFLSFRVPFPGPLVLPELGVEEAAELAMISSGLVVIAGGAGQGKSTLFAAIARQIHRTRAGRLVLLEEVPEHPWNEEGRHVIRIAFCHLAADREEVVRGAFSLDPDFLLLDAPVDRRLLRILVEETARTGALVVATFCRRGAAEVLRELCAALPKGAGRPILVRTLSSILALELVPDATGKERVVASELFRNAPAAAAALLKAELGQIESVLVAGGGSHFQPIDDSLWRRFQQGLVTMEAAYARCRYRPRWVERMHSPDISRV
ncbi:MAG: ATPase, T2SS/T4P/T4SS family [Candidatus Methylacidiphilaceae bacterium]